MKKFTLAAILAISCLMASAQLRTKAYVSYTFDSISAIDAQSLTFDKPIRGIQSFFPLLDISPNDSTLLITDRNNRSVYMINAINDKNIKVKQYDYSINGLDYSPNKKHLYFDYTYQIMQIDTATLTIIDSFKIAEFNGFYYDVYYTFIDDSTFVHSHYKNKKVYKYNMNIRQNVDSMPGWISHMIMYDGKGYCANNGKVFIFDPDLMIFSDSVTSSTNITTLWSPPTLYKNKLYFDGTVIGSPNRHYVETFDIATKKFEQPVELDFISQFHLSPEGDLWMVDQDGKRIIVYSIAEKDIIGQITTKNYPYDIVFGKGNNHKSSIGAVNGIINLNLYPNPTTNKITLETGFNEVKNYTIINSLGKTIMSIKSTGTETEVDVSNLPPGVYFVIPDGDKTRAIKFLKQ